MSFNTFLSNIYETVKSWFLTEEAAIIEFFGPLMIQVKDAALELGKGDLQVGLQVIQHAALAAVTAAATAKDNKVEAAEAAFLAVGASEGIVAIHNAEAGAIKAAVAIIQQQAAAHLNPVTAVAVGQAADSVGDEILKKLGNN